MDQEQAEREEGISQSGRLSLFSTVVPVLSTESSKEQAMAENREQNESQQAPREQSAQQAPRESGQPASETSHRMEVSHHFGSIDSTFGNAVVVAYQLA